MQVESRLRFSISASADNVRNMVSNVLSSRHLANRAYKDCQGPYAFGNSPLRAIQSITLSMFQLSFGSRSHIPALSGGSSSFMCSHCSFVNSYLFMSLFLHGHFICAIFSYQTRPGHMGLLPNSACFTNQQKIDKVHFCCFLLYLPHAYFLSTGICTMGDSGRSTGLCCWQCR